MASAVDTKFDNYIWLFIALLVASGVFGLSYFSIFSLPLKILAYILLASAALFLSYQTEQGKQAVALIRGASVELKKVIWPTQKETLQTAGIVLLMITIMGLFLWGLDAVLFKIMGLLTGHQGA